MFDDNYTLTTISLLRPTSCLVGLDVTNGIVTDVLQATQVTTGPLTLSGATIVGNCGVSNALTTGSMACTGDVTANNISVGGVLTTPHINLPTSAFLNVNNAARIKSTQRNLTHEQTFVCLKSGCGEAKQRCVPKIGLRGIEKPFC